MVQQQEFTRYEIARILGARALQVAMDAPLLLKISEEELDEIKYDAIKIAEKEFDAGVLPITVRRPLPRKKDGKLESIKEERIDDKKIIEKEKEIEKEIKEGAKEMGFTSGDEDEEAVSGGDSSGTEQ
jgi:DNA-directed RNA polymerase subunit K